jgi:hypothetical protein
MQLGDAVGNRIRQIIANYLQSTDFACRKVQLA